MTVDQAALIALRNALPIHEGGTAATEAATALANLGGVPLANQPYDIPGFTNGKPGASEVLIAFLAPRAFTLAANCALSLAQAGTGATTLATFLIARNGTTVASFAFAAAGQGGPASATFSAQGAVTFAVGDVLTVTAPSGQDATLSDLRFALAATLA